MIAVIRPWYLYIRIWIIVGKINYKKRFFFPTWYQIWNLSSNSRVRKKAGLYLELYETNRRNKRMSQQKDSKGWFTLDRFWQKKTKRKGCNRKPGMAKRSAAKVDKSPRKQPEEPSLDSSLLSYFFEDDSKPRISSSAKRTSPRGRKDDEGERRVP